MLLAQQLLTADTVRSTVAVECELCWHQVTWCSVLVVRSRLQYVVGAQEHAYAPGARVLLQRREQLDGWHATGVMFSST